MVGRFAVCAALLATAAGAGILWRGSPPVHIQVDCSEAATGQLVLVEQSSSGRSRSTQDARLAHVEKATIESAVCETALSVAAWSSSASVVELWGPADVLEVPGGTERARGNRALPIVDEAMGVVLVPRWAQALGELPGDRSDVASWPAIASDLIAGGVSDDGSTVEVLVLTDGVHVGEGVDLNTVLSVDDAIGFADALPDPPDLSGISVTIAGIGQVDGSPPPAGGTWVDAIRAFNQRLCERTGAECRVTTTIGGGS